MYVCMYIYIHMYTCMYTCRCRCLYVCTHTHGNLYIALFSLVCTRQLPERIIYLQEEVFIIRVDTKPRRPAERSSGTALAGSVELSHVGEQHLPYAWRFRQQGPVDQIEYLVVLESYLSEECPVWDP